MTGVRGIGRPRSDRDRIRSLNEKIDRLHGELAELKAWQSKVRDTLALMRMELKAVPSAPGAVNLAHILLSVFRTLVGMEAE